MPQEQIEARNELKAAIEKAVQEGFTHDDALGLFYAVLEYLKAEESEHG